MVAPSPLLTAVYRGDRAAAEKLLDDGKTALTIAEEQGHAQVARRLRGELP